MNVRHLHKGELPRLALALADVLLLALRTEVALPEIESRRRGFLRRRFEIADGDGGIAFDETASQIGCLQE